MDYHWSGNDFSHALCQSITWVSDDLSPTRPFWMNPSEILSQCNDNTNEGNLSTLQWHNNERDGFSNRQPYHCLLNRLFRGRSKKTSKLRVTGRCAGNSPVTGEFLAHMASNAENVSISWRHHDKLQVSLLKIIDESLHEWPNPFLAVSRILSDF